MFYLVLTCGCIQTVLTKTKEIIWRCHLGIFLLVLNCTVFRQSLLRNKDIIWICFLSSIALYWGFISPELVKELTQSLMTILEGVIA